MKKSFVIFIGIVGIILSFVLRSDNSSAASTFFDTPPAPYPQVGYSFAPSNPGVTQSVQFTDSSSCFSGVTAGGVPISSPCVAFSWNFGDGNTSSVKNPAHSFSSQSTFISSLFVTDTFGNSCFTSQNIAVSAGGAPTPKKTPTYIEVPPR